MPREYYVYPNGTPIAVAGNNEYATQIPMSAGDATDVYTAISVVKSSYVKKSGDTMSGQLQFSGNSAANIVVPARSMSYINKDGNAGIYAKKTLNSDQWYPVVCEDTKGGGHWQIGNYDNENLEFVYGTKTNRDSNTNNTQKFSIVPWNDNSAHSAIIAHSGNVGTGDNNGQVKIAGTNVSVKGLGSAAYQTATADRTASTVVMRNANNYIYTVYLNTTCSSVNIASYTSEVAFISSDNFLRKTSLTNFKNWFGTANIATRVHNYNSGNFRFYAATSVIILKSNSQQLVTLATLNSVFGVNNCGGGNTAVFACNGDGNAWGGRFTGCNLVGSGWNVMTHDTVPSAAVRVNWFALYWG
jgi:hypothetical protein